MKVEGTSPTMKMHLSLPVRSIEETQQFYQLLFAAPATKQKSDYVKFEPERLPLNISFHATGRPFSTDRHLGIELSSLEELDAEFARLEAAGLISKMRETSVCCYARQDKFWVSDPSGYDWELYVRLADTEAKMDQATGCCGDAAAAPATGCCAG